MFTKLIIGCLLMSVTSILSQNPFMKKSCGYYNHLGTKTPYRNVANMDTSPFTFKGKILLHYIFFIVTAFVYCRLCLIENMDDDKTWNEIPKYQICY